MDGGHVDVDDDDGEEEGKDGDRQRGAPDRTGTK